MIKENYIIQIEEKEYEVNKDVFNLIKICIGNNIELKKQLDKANDELYTLKNKYNIRLLNQISENIEPDCEDYYLAEIETKANKYDLIQTQQQEFIKYLEEEKEYFLTWSGDMYEDDLDIRKSISHGIYKEVYRILEKYKEIIGNKDE